MFLPCAIALLSWGALAFGAEYTWSYAPLLVFSSVVGLLGIIASPGLRFPSRPLVLALLVLFGVVILQLVPLSERVVTVASPSSVAVDYRQLHERASMRPGNSAAATDLTDTRQLSIAPDRTVLGLTFLMTLTLLFIGCARGLGAVGPTVLARAVVALAVIVALVELIQKASGSDVVYGFWYPPQLKGYESAPFINRNHTAGWLVMALSLAAGHLAGSVACGWRHVRSAWRQRVLCLSTPDGGEALLTASAITVVALATVITESRSGLLCLLLAVVLWSGWTAFRQVSWRRRLIAGAYLMCVLALAISWGRADNVLRRFEAVRQDVRVGIWSDTLRIIQDFPLTGTGLNTFGIAMLHYQTVPGNQLFIEAHSDYLQLLAEGGLLLTIPAVVAVILFIGEVRRRFKEAADDTRTYWLRAGAVTALCVIAAQETVEFTLQMPGAAVLFVILGAIAIHRPACQTHRASIT